MCAANGKSITSAVEKNSGFEYVPQARVANEWKVVDAIFDLINSGKSTTSFSTP